MGPRSFALPGPREFGHGLAFGGKPQEFFRWIHWTVLPCRVSDGSNLERSLKFSDNTNRTTRVRDFQMLTALCLDRVCNFVHAVQFCTDASRSTSDNCI